MDAQVIRLLAPASGPLRPLTEVPDAVFAEKMIGDGLGFDPTTDLILAPCAGKVLQLHPSRHAITIGHSSGVQVLLHVGIDTVKLKGQGFSPHVQVGDEVAAGQPLLRFDPDFVAQNARSLISVMVIAGGPRVAVKTLRSGEVTAGRDAVLELKVLGPAQTLASDSAGGSVTSAPVRVALATGLHARPAALVVAAAKTYASEIELKKGELKANAKSVVGLLGLEIASGEDVRFVASGPDAEAAIQALTKLLANLEEAHEPALPAAHDSVRTSTSRSPHILAGVSASPGLVVGRVHQIRPQAFEISEAGRGFERERDELERALAEAKRELAELQDEVRGKTDASQAAIFAAHQELLEDPDLTSMALRVLNEGRSAAFAWNEAINHHAERLSRLNNELMANRANDLRDVGRRVLRILVGQPAAAATAFRSGTILIAENLTPSDTAQLDREKVLGFCTTTGGATSHVAILARSLGLPAIAGIDTAALALADGTEVVLDGEKAELRLHPSEEEKAVIRREQERSLEARKKALSSADQPATTKDGVTIEIAANVGGVADTREAVEMGCDGVGLLRSEFLFLERSSAPTEEEQYRIYQEIADILGPRPLTIRTLDVGGDKPLQYLPIPPEENPFLGIRGVRVGLRNPEILREQLRAILRVKTRGPLNIMFPMVATLEELLRIKEILSEERARVRPSSSISVGIMVEVPSAALMADVLAPHVDFFSIGTNDLTQYTLAMDRGHKDLARQVDGLHPSVLKLIDLTVKAAHAHGKWVGVCGGIAGDPRAVPVLVGLGVDELSVSVPVIPVVKSQVRELSRTQSGTVAGKALTAADAKDVRQLTHVHP